MSDLVKGRRQDDGAEEDEQQPRLVHGRADALADAVDAEQPDVERDEGSDERDDHRRPEERLEELRDDVRVALGDERGAELQRQQLVGLGDLRARAVGFGEHAERAQLALDEELDVAGADLAAELRA